MRFTKVSLLGLAVLTLASPASAVSTQKGTARLAIQLSRGVADLAVDNQTGLLPSTTMSVAGLQAQYWYFLADGYGLSASLGVGYFKESNTADPGLGSFDLKQTVTSWSVRLGGDRFAKVSERLEVFAGPGIEVWSGRLKTERASIETEHPSTFRLGLGGRIGAHITLAQNVGLVGHIGQYWAYAVAKKGEAKTQWLPSGSDGAMGFSFGF